MDEPQPPIKRVKYFTGQFLEAVDFQLEQSYHVDMRRLGNRVLFSAGILDDGFQVSIKPGDPTRIVIRPGVGVDAQGREIVIRPRVGVDAQGREIVQDFEITVPVPTTPLPASGIQPYRVALKYREQEADQQTVDTDFSDNTRYLEDPEVNFFVDGATIDGRIWIVIGGIGVDAAGSTTTSTPATPVRVHANARVFGSLELGTATTVPSARLHVADGAVAVSQGATLAHADAAIHVSGSAGGFGRLLQMNPLGASQDGLNLLSSRSAVAQDQWWSWGVTAGDKWRIRKGTDLSGVDGLTIDATGNVGMGTVNPQALLDVAGSIRAGNSDLYFTKTDHIHTGIGNATGFAAIENASVFDALMILGRTGSAVPGDPAAPPLRVVKLWDFLQVNGTLQMSGGALMPTAGNSEAAGVLFQKDPGGGAGDRAWLRYYARSGEDTTLELGTSNDAADHIALMPSGNVGIGKIDPQARLHVKGEAGLLNLEGSTHAYIQWFPMGFGAARKGWIGFGNSNTTELTVANEAGVLNINGQAGVRVGGLGKLNVAGALIAETDALVRGQLGVVGVLNASSIAAVAITASSGISTNNISYSGTLSNLNVGPNDPFAYIRSHDLLFGHPTRRGQPGRALVDDTGTLVVNFDQDWPNVRINGTVTTPSSRTLKENIRSLSSDVATRIVSSLEPVSFSYKRHKAQSDSLGFIAEEAPPEVVADGGDAIVMNHIVAALTKVVKDQQRLIEALGARVALLENASRPVSA